MDLSSPTLVIHPFCEGNTRSTAVFAIKYLRNFGFDINNEAFAKNSWYFRNALVRANMHISKCQIGPLDVTLEEKVLLEFVKANPKATQEHERCMAFLRDAVNQSTASKRIMVTHIPIIRRI